MSTMRPRVLALVLAIAALAAIAPARAEQAAAPESGMSVPPTTPPSTVPDPDRPPRTTSGKVRASTDARLPPALGPNPAKVVVIVYSDFQCPVCARATDATRQIPEEWPGDVRVEFRQHPLGIHKNAENAAVASLAAHRQGKFWQMHDVLFANQSALDPDSLARYARTVGLDVERFRKDVADPALRARVQQEGALADRLGAAGTPGFLVNGRLSVGWGSWQGFRGQVQQELETVNGLLAKGTKLAAVHALRAQALAKDAAAFEAYKTAVIDPLAAAARGARPSAPRPAVP
jgi:protein-disulfide isomerase